VKILALSPDSIEAGSGIASAVLFQSGMMKRMGLEIEVVSRKNDVTHHSIRKKPGILGTIPYWHRSVKRASRRTREFDLIWLHSPLLLDLEHLKDWSKIVISFHSTYLGQYLALKNHRLIKTLPYYWLVTKLEGRFLKSLSKLGNIADIAYVAVSSNVRNELRSNGLDAGIQVIPNGLVRADLPAKHEARERIRKKHLVDVTDQKTVLLFVGRLTEVKQPLLLINLVKKILDRDDSIILMLCGSGNLRNELQSSIDCSNIHILGKIPRSFIWNFYCAADSYISLSCYEGNPVSVLEAASAGLPLVLSDIPAHRWLLESSLGKGILISSKNPSPNEVMRFLDKIRKGHRWISYEERHSWRRNCEQYVEVMERLTHLTS